MSIVTAVNRSLGKAVRATHAETHSPYFAAAVLAHHLRPLGSRLAQVHQSRPDLLAVLAHHLRPLGSRLAQVHQSRPDLLAVLADHLGTAATLPAVTTEIRTRAANLLTRRQEMDTPPERYRLPRTPRRTRPVSQSYPR